MKSYRATLFLAVLALPAASRDAAAGDAAAAAAAFADGQRALLQGDHDRAADFFELANSIEPSKEALRSAVRAHREGGHLARAATLSEDLLARYSDDATSVALAGEVLVEATQKLGRVDLTCEGACTVSMSGRALSVAKAGHHVFYLPPGDQVLSVGFGDRSAAYRLRTSAGARVDVHVRAPPAPPVAPRAAATPPRPTPARPRRGLPRIVPLVAASLTLLGAGAATWSSFDTRAAHKDYAAMPDHGAWLDGRSKQLRTNVLWGVTAGAGLVTLATAYWTNWRPAKESARLSVLPSSRDVILVFSAPL